MHIRPYVEGEEAQLRQVFMSSVHGLASSHYRPAQLAVWAPAWCDSELWAQRIRANRPWLAIVEGQIAAYADVQPDGYIDQFFVAAAFARRGIGSALLAHLEQQALAQGLTQLSANVSLTAEALFARHGFTVQARQVVSLGGQFLDNARMSKRLAGC